MGAEVEVSIKQPWAEINTKLDALIEKVNAATIPNIIKQRLLDKLEYAKELKENAKIECEAGNFEGAKKKLGGRISPKDKASFLKDSAEIIEKIEHKC